MECIAPGTITLWTHRTAHWPWPGQSSCPVARWIRPNGFCQTTLKCQNPIPWAGSWTPQFQIGAPCTKKQLENNLTLSDLTAFWSLKKKKCQTWKVSELNGKVLELESVRIIKCQNWNVPVSESVRTRAFEFLHFPILTLLAFPYKLSYPEK